MPKWAIFAPVFVPIFVQLGVAPQTVLGRLSHRRLAGPDSGRRRQTPTPTISTLTTSLCPMTPAEFQVPPLFDYFATVPVGVERRHRRHA